MQRRIFFLLVAALMGWFAARAQQSSNASLKTLLPAGGEIIETADITTVAQKPRLIALWMLNPERNLDDRWNRNQNGGSCSDIRKVDFGKFWAGPTRLSLVDSVDGTIINTIEVREDCGGCREPSNSFMIPLCVSTRYSIDGKPISGGAKERPNLDLRDLTGQRLKAEFTLAGFEAFDSVSTGVFGYQPRFDRIVQYPIEIEGVAAPMMWTEEVFAREPERPGYWMFTCRPGHGDLAAYRIEVSFDPKRLLFHQSTSRVPNTNRPE